jgi:hypothetical protein
MWSFFSKDPTKDFPYEIGDPITTNPDRVVWKLHKGKKKVRETNACPSGNEKKKLMLLFLS